MQILQPPFHLYEKVDLPLRYTPHSHHRAFAIVFFFIPIFCVFIPPSPHCAALNFAPSPEMRDVDVKCQTYRRVQTGTARGHIIAAAQPY